MFVIHMPKSFRVGDTKDCRINGEPKQVTWRDEDTLVIDPDDARAIVSRFTEGDSTCFMCGDPGESAGDYGLDEAADGFIVSRRSRS